MSKRSFSWNSPGVVFALVFCVVLATGTLVARELSAKGRRAPVTTPATISNWKDVAAVGQQGGSKSAPVTVIVFADYQCPGCAEFHRQLKIAHDSLGSTLRIVTRHFPLSIHKFAPEAANAAECAGDQGRFDAFEDSAYAAQDSIGVLSWHELARRAGVRDSAEFAKCVTTNRHASRVSRDLNAARTLNLSGTPTYVVNGDVYVGASDLRTLLEQLRQAVSMRQTSSVRTWLTPLELERTITGAPNDELLVPANLSALPNGEFAVFDFGSMELRAFSTSGEPRWRVGRKGAGPGEFRNAMDVEWRADGKLAVLDMANRRITTVSPAGRIVRTIPIRLSSPRIVPLPDTTIFALAAQDTSSIWFAVSSNGDSVRRVLAPFVLHASHAMERESFSAPLTNGAVVTYRWSDKIALLDSTGAVRRVVAGIEHVDFPGTRAYPLKVGKFTGLSYRVSPDAIPGALSVATHGDEVWVLFGGATGQSGRIIDIYNSTSGNYLGTHLLPVAAIELAVLSDGRVAALRNEPLPAVDILRVTRDLASLRKVP